MRERACELVLFTKLRMKEGWSESHYQTYKKKKHYKECYKILYTKKLDSLDERDKFPE